MTMTMPALNADAFKKIACAIHPYLCGMTFPTEIPDCSDQEMHDCLGAVSEILANGNELEDFCRKADMHLLLGVCEFCKAKWAELRLRELGLV